MNRIFWYLALSMLLFVGVVAVSAVDEVWSIGQNRIRNSDFNNDEIGKTPKEWALQKGG